MRKRIRKSYYYEKYDKPYRKYKILSGLCIRCSRIRESYRLKNTTCRRCATKMSMYYKRRKYAT